MSDHHPVDLQKNRCPRCNKAYDFWTDNGKLVGPSHPFGDCKTVPRWTEPAVKMCVECRAVPTQRSRFGHHAQTCSPECGALRKLRLKKEQAIERHEVRMIHLRESEEWFREYEKRQREKKKKLRQQRDGGE